MNVRQLMNVDFLVLLFLILFCNVTCFEEDYEDAVSFGRCSWIKNKLKNGRVKIRSRGRIAKFLCDPGYELAGKRFATCVRGQWNNPIPVCVARGCGRMSHISNGRFTEMYRGAMLVYDCNPGYSLDGVLSIYCDGRKWSTDPPSCVASTADPELTCDFEDPDLCGWSHSPNNDFDWKRNQFSTPSGHVGTGPSYDHTFGIGKGGFYLYLEASSPRNMDDKARLFSPVYPPDYNKGCFLFWYHMYGASIGSLRVYVKPESYDFGEFMPTWEKVGEQGNDWIRGHIPIPELNENFQIVIEGVRGASYVGDIGIDDVQITKHDCTSMENETVTIAHTIAESCRGRCREADNESSCGCNDNCYVNHNCCNDYTTICISGNDTAAEEPEEQLPKIDLGTTSTPIIITTNETINETTFTTLSKIAITSSTTLPPHSTVPTSNPVTLTDSSTITAKTLPTSTESNTFPPSTASVPKSSTPLLTTQSKTTTTTMPASSEITSNKISAESSSVTVIPVTNHLTEHATSPVIPTTVFKTSVITVISAQETTPSTTSTKTIPMSTTSIKTSVPSTSVEITDSTTVARTTQKTTPSTSSALSTEKSSTTTSATSVVSTSVKTTSVETTTPKLVTPIMTSTLSTSSEMSSPTTISSITSMSSTRKTYNLRPRTTKTSPIYLSSTVPNSSPAVGTTTEVLSKATSTSVTPISGATGLTSTKSPGVYTTKIEQSTRHYYTFPTRSTEHFQPPKSTTSKPSATLQTTRIIPIQITDSTQPTFKTTAAPKSLENHASKTATSASRESLPTATIVSVSVVVIMCLVGGLVYYLRKRKDRRQSKLSDDSEMRFLSDNEDMEYSDASLLDKILVK